MALRETHFREEKKREEKEKEEERKKRRKRGVQEAKVWNFVWNVWNFCIDM